jgi:hypothetical protein
MEAKSAASAECGVKLNITTNSNNFLQWVDDGLPLALKSFPHATAVAMGATIEKVIAMKGRFPCFEHIPTTIPALKKPLSEPL